MLKQNIKKYQRIIFSLVGIVVFVGIILKLINVWSNIKGQFAISNYRLLILSIVLFTAFFILLAIGWSLIFRQLSQCIDLKELVYLFSYSQLARYLPGGIWNYVGRVSTLLGRGIKYRDIIQSTIMEGAFLITSCLTVGILLCYRILNSIEIILGTGAALIFLVFLFYFSTIINFALRVIGKPDIHFINLRKYFVVIMLLYYVAMWVTASIAFGLFIKSIAPLGCDINIISASGLFPMSWVVGFISPVPGGIGVRESILIILLSRLFSNEFSYIVSVFSRGQVIIGELTSFTIVAIAAKNHKKFK